MAERYNVQYNDVENVLYEISIFSDSYTGESISVTGKAIYGLNTLEDIRHPIRAKYLQLDLLAVEVDDFDDLLSSQEREWSVTLSRAGGVIFFGYLTSEGVVQDYYKKERYISFDVLDPIGFLQDLAYADNVSGTQFLGIDQVARVISKCLKRGFEIGSTAFDIVDYVPYDYKSLNPSTGTEIDYVTGRFLKDNTIDQEQYIDDESGEIKSCLNVLSDLLYSLQLCITQYEGRVWLIHHYLYDMSTIGALYTNEYDSDGNDTTGVNVSPFSKVAIESFDGTNRGNLLHVNENQQYFYKRGLEELATNYEFVVKKQLLDNPSFEGGTTGVSMPGWSSGGGTYAVATGAGYMQILKFDSNVNPNDIATVSASSVAVDVGNAITVVGEFVATYENALFYFNVRLDSYTQASPYYLKYVGDIVPVWAPSPQATTNVFVKGAEDAVVEFTFELPAIPFIGLLTVEVFATRDQGTQTPVDPTKFIRLNYLDLQGSQINTQGVTYKTIADDIDSLKTEKIDTFFDTNNFSINSNQFIKFQLGNPIISIRDRYFGLTFEKLGAILSKNYMKAKRRRIIFTGDVWGFVEPHKYISIPDLSSNDFVFTEYRFDTALNIVSVKLVERDSSNIVTTQTVNVIYASTVDPTIKS